MNLKELCKTKNKLLCIKYRNGKIATFYNRILFDEFKTKNVEEEYNFDLTHKNKKELDIVYIYNAITGDKMYLRKNCLPTLSSVEFAILTGLDNKYKYIARDYSTGRLYIYIEKPEKDSLNNVWRGDRFESMIMFNHLFQFINWENDEPYSIKDLIGE